MKTVVGAGVVLPRQHDVNLIKSRQIGRGRKRAAFWRALGYPNLQRAWATNRRKGAERRAAKALAEAKVNSGERACLESSRDDI